MKKAKILLSLMLTGALLSACGNIEKGTSNISPNQGGEEQQVVTGKQDGSNYQALITDGKYQTSRARGLTATILNSNYNARNFEKGLLELSKSEFKTDNYLYQEGQLMDREFILRLVNRKSDGNPQGLNPAEQGEPIVFQQILEQDYYLKDSRELGGISLGIALNSVDYSGDTPKEISDDTVRSEGERVASLILEQLRELPGAADVPVKIGLFKQGTKDEIAGGNFFASAVSKSGSELSEWQDVNEKYIALPSKGKETLATEDGLENKYTDFKNSVLNFFPNSSGITGVAYYRDNELQKFSITIETKYFAETEILNLTQFVAQTVEQVFNVAGDTEVVIKTLNGFESLIVKKPNEAAEIHVLN